MKLRDAWRSNDEQCADLLKAARRRTILACEIDEIDWPFAGTVNIDDGLGPYLIRAFVKPDPTATPEQLRAAVSLVAHQFGGRMDRQFREERGTFFWRSPTVKRRDLTAGEDFEVLVLLENMNAMHPECKVTKVKKEVEVYVSDCNKKDEVTA